MGLKIKEGDRIGLLSDEMIKRPMLEDVRKELLEMAGIEVNFMLYKNPAVMYTRGPVIELFD